MRMNKACARTMEGKSVSDLYDALLIDIGNTRIKYALVNKLTDLHQVEYCQQVQDLSASIQKSKQVLLSSVGHLTQVQALESLCQQHNIPCRVIQTQAEALGVLCAYENYQTLGVDRWLAILAVHEMTSLPVAVLDLGTANTCDIVIENQHIGGWIAPGFSLMRESLLSNTQQIYADSSFPDNLDLGKSTPNCVSYGCLAAQSGFVLMAEQYLREKYADYRIYISGGGQNLLSVAENKRIHFLPNLVLRGLFRLI